MQDIGNTFGNSKSGKECKENEVRMLCYKVEQRKQHKNPTIHANRTITETNREEKEKQTVESRVEIMITCIHNPSDPLKILFLGG